MVSHLLFYLVFVFLNIVAVFRFFILLAVIQHILFKFDRVLVRVTLCKSVARVIFLYENSARHGLMEIIFIWIYTFNNLGTHLKIYWNYLLNKNCILEVNLNFFFYWLILHKFLFVRSHESFVTWPEPIGS